MAKMREALRLVGKLAVIVLLIFFGVRWANTWTEVNQHKQLHAEFLSPHKELGRVYATHSGGDILYLSLPEKAEWKALDARSTVSMFAFFALSLVGYRVFNLSNRKPNVSQSSRTRVRVT